MVRQEQGEKFNRPHYHVLYGWRGQKATVGQCFTLNNSWLNAHKVCGWARHFVYNPGQDAVGYITKALSGSARDTLAASNYEAAKFGWSVNEVTLSASLVRLVSLAQRVNAGIHPGQCGKRSETKCGQSSEKEAPKTNREGQPVYRSERDPRSIIHRLGNWQRR